MENMTDRQEALARAQRIVVKVGSAVLTDAAGLNLPVLAELARQLAAMRAQGRQVTLVSSGAVAAGRAALGGRLTALGGALAGLPGKQAAAAIGQSRLMHAWDAAFAQCGVVTAQVLLTRDDFRIRSRFLNMRHTFGRLAECQVLPIVNENDTVAVQELKFGDNDTLGSLLLNAVEAELFINLTSSGGVFADNPQTRPDAPILAEIADVDALDLNTLCGGKTESGSGGMYSKLLAARRAAHLGVPTLILPGRQPDVIGRALAGEPVGTWVRARAKGVSRRKFWLAYARESAGAVIVDAGAARALRERGGSLLPAGIVHVEGHFGPGALVRLFSEDRQPLGVGLSNYSAADLRQLMGRGRGDSGTENKAHPYLEAVHRDNMMLGAVM